MEKISGKLTFRLPVSILARNHWKYLIWDFFTLSRRPTSYRFLSKSLGICWSDCADMHVPVCNFNIAGSPGDGVTEMITPVMLVYIS